MLFYNQKGGANMKDRIKSLRKSKGYNQTEFGKMINLSQNAIAGYENGVRNIPDRVVSDICRVFNISESWLRDGIEPMESIDHNQKIKNYIDEQIKDNSELNDALKKLADMTPKEWQLVYDFIQQFKDKSD